MKQFFFGFHLLAILWAITTIAQVTRFPATIQLQVVPPYSVFLSDYTDPINGKLQANITFNDFNEPQWRVKFRLSIESNTLRLRTKASFIPNPTTILPGVPVPLTGADLAEYFRYENLDISGGKEDKESSLAKGWIGTQENYFFNETNGSTELTIEIETMSDWTKMFNDGYPAALNKLKKICEHS